MLKRFLLLTMIPASAMAQTAPANVQMANGQPRTVTPVTSVSAPSHATAQTTVGTAATLVAPARSGRIRLLLTVGAANSCAFGNAGVTLTTGFPLQPVAGASLTVHHQAAEYAVCSASTVIGVMEEF